MKPEILKFCANIGRCGKSLQHHLVLCAWQKIAGFPSTEKDTDKDIDTDMDTDTPMPHAHNHGHRHRYGDRQFPVAQKSWRYRVFSS
jgi:hypothetical protein